MPSFVFAAFIYFVQCSRWLCYVSLYNVSLSMGISKEIKVKTIAIDEARINAISIKVDNVYHESVLQFQNFCFACFLFLSLLWLCWAC